MTDYTNKIHSNNGRFVVIEAGGIQLILDANTSALKVTEYLLTGSNASPIIDGDGEWNTSGSPVLINFNVDDTASGANSAFLRFSKNGVRHYEIDKNGNIHLGNTNDTVWITNDHGRVAFSNTGVITIGNHTDPNLNVLKVDPVNRQVMLASDVALGWSSNTQLDGTMTGQLGNGGTLYNPTSSTPHTEYGGFAWSGNNFIIQTGNSGAGTQRYWRLVEDLTWAQDGVRNLGDPTHRPKDGYFANSVICNTYAFNGHGFLETYADGHLKFSNSGHSNGGFFHTENILARKKIGFDTGGTVTQTGNKSTAVTLNAPSGRITTMASGMVGTAVEYFTLNNSYIGQNDVVVASYVSGASGGPHQYTIWACAPTNGTCVIAVRCMFGTDFIDNESGGYYASFDSLVINFVVISGSVT